LHHRLRTLLAN